MRSSCTVALCTHLEIVHDFCMHVHLPLENRVSAKSWAWECIWYVVSAQSMPAGGELEKAGWPDLRSVVVPPAPKESLKPETYDTWQN